MSAHGPAVFRFESKVSPEPNTGCHLWTAAINKTGYGIFNDGIKTSASLAHRVSYALYVGPIPEGMAVLHRCDTPTCVNPKHLFLGTQADNMRDMAQKNRTSHGEAHPCARVTRRVVQEIRLRARTESQARLAAIFGLSQSAISLIVNKRTWAAA